MFRRFYPHRFAPRWSHFTLSILLPLLQVRMKGFTCSVLSKHRISMWTASVFGDNLPIAGMFGSWHGSGFPGFSICLNRPCMLFCQIGQLFSCACLVYRSRSVLAQMGLPLDPQGLLASPSWVNLWKRTSRVTRITLVLWIGNGTLRLLPSSSRCRQGPFWQRNLKSRWRVRQYKETM